MGDIAILDIGILDSVMAVCGYVLRIMLESLFDFGAELFLNLPGQPI